MEKTLTQLQPAVRDQFLAETLQGLNASPKFMHSKYFYDERGDHIFQQIMDMDDYYLTNAEMDIFTQQVDQIAAAITAPGNGFDLIELGAGDGTKTIHLLRTLLNRNATFTYLPIDISEHVIRELTGTLPQALPGLDITGLNGDYFDMLQKASERSGRRKVVLFMGANIGNMDVAAATQFCKALRRSLSGEDMLLIGFDLKKNPRKILAAYNDSDGITASFNLNLLRRINNELDGTFVLSNFEHYASYDPQTGACKSYLISLKEQDVSIGGHKVSFGKDEYIYMEISQKYAVNEIADLATAAGFEVSKHFFDRQHYFVDSLWKTG